MFKSQMKPTHNRPSSRVTTHLEKVADEMVLDEDVSNEYLMKLLPTTAASKI